MSHPHVSFTQVPPPCIQQRPDDPRRPPSSRLELLDEVEVTPRPADAVISAFFRARRFIGAKDRAAVAETVYGVLRRHARLRWWFTHAGGFPINSRTLLIADQILAQGRPADHLDRLFSGGRFAPPQFSSGEIKLANKLEGHTLDHPDMPEQVQVECPDWAAGLLRDFLGDRFVPELTALLDPAPLDLRVNTVKGDRDAAIAALASAGIEGEPTRWSPFGIRIHGRPPLASTDAFKAGLVEIQDEGSQLIGLLTDAKPGHQVVDFCSGAGGKALAIAAGMGNKGRLIACDVLEKRLKRAAERFAGRDCITSRPVRSPASVTPGSSGTRASSTACWWMRPVPAPAHGGAIPTAAGGCWVRAWRNC